MNGNHKFEQIWGFRRNDDSSSDDSRSNSDIRNGQEKVKLVPNLVSPENERVSETNDQTIQVEKKTKRARKAPKKENKKEAKIKPKPKRDLSVSSNIKKGENSSRKKKKKNKSTLISQMTVSDDLKIFTKSIVDDLRVARETMFSKMREEMDQLFSSANKKGGTRSINPVKKPKQKQKPRVRKPSKQNQKKELALAVASKDHDNLPKEQHNVENKKDPSSKTPILIDSNGKNPNLIDSSAKKPILIDSNNAKKPTLMDSSAKKPIFTNGPEQIVTSAHLPIPLVMSNSRPNDTSLHVERGYYSGIGFGQENTESSCVGNGYPVGLNHHQRFENANNFGMPNQVFQGYGHDGSLLGTRMMNGGGIRYNAGFSGHSTMPNHFGSSSGFRNIYPN